LLAAARKWKDKQIIDPERYYKRKNPLLELNKSKTLSPLILIDPVQPSRNVTAALSEEVFRIFTKAAARFLDKPSKNFFSIKMATKKELIRTLNNKSTLLILDILPKKDKTDVMGAALLNRYNLLKTNLQNNEFKINKSSWQWSGNSAMFWFIISKKNPSIYDERKGPRISDKANSLRFKAKHKRTYTKKGRLYATTKRKFPTPQKLVNFVTKQGTFKNRIKTVKREWH